MVRVSKTAKKAHTECYCDKPGCKRSWVCNMLGRYRDYWSWLSFLPASVKRVPCPEDCVNGVHPSECVCEGNGFVTVGLAKSHVECECDILIK